MVSLDQRQDKAAAARAAPGGLAPPTTPRCRPGVPGLGALRTAVLTALLALSLQWAAVANANGIAVIVHPDNPVESLNLQELSDLYLGRGHRVTDHQHLAVVFDYSSDNHHREGFYRSITGADITRINAYWARLRFSGQMTPPVVQPSPEAMLEAVRRNPRSIGYVPSAALDASVRVIAHLNPSADQP